MFPEPKEFSLGLALGSPDGAGTGRDFAKKIAQTLDLVRKENAKHLASIAGFALFCNGIGMDRTSDILCNILKSRFITYTQKISARQHIPTKTVMVKNASWDRRRRRWNDAWLNLPTSPLANGAILLAPQRFLKEIPRVTPDGFWNWAEVNASQELRDDLNFDLSNSLTKSEKIIAARTVATSRPNLAFNYLENIKAESHQGYDVEADPQGLVSWFEDGQSAHALSPGKARATVPSSPTDFNIWVQNLIDDFKYVVEETDAWQLLWNEDRTSHRKEQIAQAVAGIMWRAECKASNVDISKEVNMGRGPVDFKFSQGWNRRALIEVKFIESSHFFTGASRQLPQYLVTEQIDCGFYLAIGFSDADFSDERLKRVTDTCKSLSDQKGVSIKAVFVDARATTKKSASTLTEKD